ncbi:hypothetical protein QYE76_042136 [Lolium multiflorum]|uniref:Uncharacterized protein n=1 Tax=Lolium multiflorum TaxID=4521 RepID=A0AAD8WX12_LOLMU|nr:hypothetical protein QYE76_042136 [Lolium multiflorum]
MHAYLLGQLDPVDECLVLRHIVGCGAVDLQDVVQPAPLWRGDDDADSQVTAHFGAVEVHLRQQEPITMLGYELRQAAEELYRLLWPTETLPGDLANLITWLENAPDRLLDWKELAARAGADMALSFVVSWYEEVNLDQLTSRRAGVEDALSAETKTRRLARECAIANFINKSTFVEDPNPPKEEEEEADEDEDTADAEEDAPEANPAPGSDAPPAGPPPAAA